MVALSTTEAEYMAGTEAAREAIWIRSLCLLLDAVNNGSTELRGNNQGALALAKNPVFHQRTKHIDIWHQFIRECVDNKIITVFYINTKDMLTNSFIKALPKDTFIDYVNRMGIFMSGKPDSSESVPERKRRYECTHCGNLFKDGRALNKHMMIKEN